MVFSVGVMDCWTVGTVTVPWFVFSSLLMEGIYGDYIGILLLGLCRGILSSIGGV